MIIKIVLKDGTEFPYYETEGSAGMDLRATERMVLLPNQEKMVGSGICIEIPKGYFGLVCSRSGLSHREGLVIGSGVGVIDSDYRGEIKLPMKNHDDTVHIIDKGDRVAQLIIVPYEKVNLIQTDTIGDTERGVGGFGSTGRK